MPWTFYSATGQKLSSAVTNIASLDIDGATDIGAAIVDADLFIIDDGAGGTNRKTTASRLKTYTSPDISCRVYNSGNQTISNATWTDLTFDSELYDTDTMHDTSSNTNRITFTTAGVYVVSAHVNWTAGTTADRFVGIQHTQTSGTSYIALQHGSATALVGAMEQSVAVVAKFAASDYVTMQVRHNQGSNLDTIATAHYGSYFGAAKILG
jgi:hypothetical protein